MLEWLKTLDPLVAAALVSAVMGLLIALVNVIAQYLIARANQQKGEKKDSAETAKTQADAAKTITDAADSAVELALKVHDREIAALKAEIVDLYSGINILIAQLEQRGIKPYWKPQGARLTQTQNKKP